MENHPYNAPSTEVGIGVPASLTTIAGISSLDRAKDEFSATTLRPEAEIAPAKSAGLQDMC